MANEADIEIKAYNDSIVENHSVLSDALNPDALFGNSTDADKNIRKWIDKNPGWQRDILLFEFNERNIPSGVAAQKATMELKLALTELNREFQEINQKDSFTKTEWDSKIADKLNTVSEKLNAFNEVTDMKLFAEPRMQALFGFVQGLKNVNQNIIGDAINVRSKELLSDNEDKLKNVNEEVMFCVNNAPKICNQNGLNLEKVVKGDHTEINNRIEEQINWFGEAQRKMESLTAESNQKATVALDAMNSLVGKLKEFVQAENAKRDAFNAVKQWAQPASSKAQMRMQKSISNLEKLFGLRDGFFMKDDGNYDEQNAQQYADMFIDYKKESLEQLLEKAKNCPNYLKLSTQDQKDQFLELVTKQKNILSKAIQSEATAQEMQEEVRKAVAIANEKKKALDDNIKALPFGQQAIDIALHKVKELNAQVDTIEFLGEIKDRISELPDNALIGPKGILNLKGDVFTVNEDGTVSVAEKGFEEFKADFSQKIVAENNLNVEFLKNVRNQNNEMQAFNNGLKDIKQHVQRAEKAIKDNQKDITKFNGMLKVLGTDNRLEDIKKSLNGMLNQLDATSKAGRNTNSPEFLKMRNQLAETANNPTAANLEQLSRVSQKYTEEKNKGVHLGIFASPVRDSRLFLAGQIKKYAQQSVNTLESIKIAKNGKERMNLDKPMPTSLESFWGGMNAQNNVSPEQMQEKYSKMMGNLPKIDKMREERADFLDKVGKVNDLAIEDRPSMPKNIKESKAMPKVSDNKVKQNAKKEKETEVENEPIVQPNKKKNTRSRDRKKIK